MSVRPGISWLASSTAEINRARDVLAALRKPGVIDELGFLMLNGAFADRLYPGVTTIMTRARYLIFVPAIYRYLEDTHTAAGKDVDRISRDLQFDLRNVLEANKEPSFIGKESKRNLIRTPSIIYWSAMNALGIATRKISESAYQTQLSRRLIGRRVFCDDDDAAHDEEPDSLWNPDLNLSHVFDEGKFATKTDFRLRSSEARFLEARYIELKPLREKNLVSLLVDYGRKHGLASLDAINYPWDLRDVPPTLEPVLEHARCLSLLARGTTLQYFRMLLDKRREDSTEVDAAFFSWWKKSGSDILTWDVDEFFRLMTIWEAGRGAIDHQFMKGWIGRARVAGTGRQLLTDETAQQLIRRREDQVRRGKQRLRGGHHLETWSLPDRIGESPYYMDYRHRVGRQFAIDIVQGLTQGTA